MSNIIIAEANVGERLDKAMAQIHPDYSRSALAKLIEDGSVLVNNQPEKARYKLKVGDRITVDLSHLQSKPAEVAIPIVYEDDGVIVLNKPTGMLTHSKGDFNKEGTVATFIQPKLVGTKKWKASNRAGVVHRLDRGTSGVIICAKTEAAQQFLQKQFSKRNVKKMYQAIIEGALPETEGLIDVPIERNPKKPATFRAGANGKTAQTAFKVLRQGSEYSLIELRPHTGRTHQLRVHLAYLQHPIVGDEFYKGKPAPRLMLHACELEITLPSKERNVFTAPLPAQFMEFI